MPIIRGKDEVVALYAAAAERNWVVPTFCGENQTTLEAVLEACQAKAVRARHPGPGDHRHDGALLPPRPGPLLRRKPQPRHRVRALPRRLRRARPSGRRLPRRRRAHPLRPRPVRRRRRTAGRRPVPVLVGDVRRLRGALGGQPRQDRRVRGTSRRRPAGRGCCGRDRGRDRRRPRRTDLTRSGGGVRRPHRRRHGGGEPRHRAPRLRRRPALRARGRPGDLCPHRSAPRAARRLQRAGGTARRPCSPTGSARSTSGPSSNATPARSSCVRWWSTPTPWPGPRPQPWRQKACSGPRAPVAGRADIAYFTTAWRQEVVLAGMRRIVAGYLDLWYR